MDANWQLCSEIYILIKMQLYTALCSTHNYKNVWLMMLFTLVVLIFWGIYFLYLYCTFLASWYPVCFYFAMCVYSNILVSSRKNTEQPVNFVSCHDKRRAKCLLLSGFLIYLFCFLQSAASHPNVSLTCL